jgi:hypothetical protein
MIASFEERRLRRSAALEVWAWRPLRNVAAPLEAEEFTDSAPQGSIGPLLKAQCAAHPPPALEECGCATEKKAAQMLVIFGSESGRICTFSNGHRSESVNS